jgi:hypothetical protein
MKYKLLALAVMATISTTAAFAADSQPVTFTINNNSGYVLVFNNEWGPKDCNVKNLSNTVGPTDTFTISYEPQTGCTYFGAAYELEKDGKRTGTFMNIEVRRPGAKDYRVVYSTYIAKTKTSICENRDIGMPTQGTLTFDGIENCLKVK